MRAFTITCGLILAGAVLGCSSDNDQDLSDRQATWSEQQQKSLNDPMNYRPDMDRTDVSGGGLKDFDRRGFREDMKAWTLD